MKTTEPCPVCQNPNATIEHNIYDGVDRLIHVEDCPECGKSYPVVGYDCSHCKAANAQNLRELATPGDERQN